MAELFSKYLSVITISMLKFVLGPLSAVSMGLSIPETFILTVGGMMITVVGLTYLGTEARNKMLDWFPRKTKRKIFTPRNRRIVKLWKKYGITGIAFLTPLFFSPPIGTMIAISFGEKQRKIIVYMFFSAVFWGIFFSLLFHIGGSQILKELKP